MVLGRWLVLVIAGAGWLSGADAQVIPFGQTFDPLVQRLWLTPAERWGLFRESDVVTISSSNDTAVTVFARDGTVVYQGAPTTRQFPRGHYFVETAGDRSQFAVLPDDYQGASFLGSLPSFGLPDLIQRHEQIGNAWIRTGSGKWPLVETQPGAFNWSEMDGIVAGRQGRKVLAIAGDTIPAWVGPGELVSRYVLYLEALVTRYQGQLAAIEIWNEPSASKLGNDPAWLTVLAQLHAAGRAAIHAIDPTIEVVGATWNNPITYSQTATLAGLGLATNIDAFSWHDYLLVGAAPDERGKWLGTGPFIPTVPERVDSYLGALGKTNVLLYADEVGFQAQSGLGLTYPAEAGKPLPDWRRGMARAIKYIVLYRAAGVDLLVPHLLPFAPLATNTATASAQGWEYGYRGPHAKTSALLMSCYWLEGATLVDYRTLGDRVFLYAWQRADGTSLLFAWAREGQPIGLDPGHNLTATDVHGASRQPVSLTEEPVVFFSDSPDAAALLAAVMGALAETVNVPPVFVPAGTQTLLPGHPWQFTIRATDPDHEPLVYAAVSLPAGAGFDAARGEVWWTPSAAQLGAHTLDFQATDVRGASRSFSLNLLVVADPAARLANRWRFDDGAGSTAADAVGGMPGTLANFSFTPSSGWVPGRDGGALCFDGLNDQVHLLQGGPELTNNFTIAGWIRPNNAVAKGTIISLRTAYGASGLRLFWGDQKLKVDGRVLSQWQSVSFQTTPIQSQVWQHVAVVYDRGTLRGYVNGTAQETFAFGEDFVMGTSTNNRIGAEYSDWFNGSLDELRVYNRVLDRQDIAVLYRGNQPPVLTPIGPQTTTNGVLLSFTVAAGDADGDALSYGTGPLPAGAAFNPATRVFSWTPGAGQAGVYHIPFVVSDGAATDAETVAITVNGPPGGEELRVTALLVVNADTGQDILALTNGMVLDRSLLPASISIRAATQPALVPSVRLNLDNGAINRVENIAPYSLLGDYTNTDTYVPWPATTGAHTLTAIPYSQGGGGGTAGVPLTVSFSVLGGATNTTTNTAGTALTLVNADNAAVIGPLTNGAVLNLSALPPRFSIRADPIPGPVGSVRFDLDNGLINRIENLAPYSLLGDYTSSYVPWEASSGGHTLTVTTYSAGGGGGTAGPPTTVTFSVVPSGLSIAGLQVVDAATGAAVQPLTNGMVLNLAELPAQISIRADTAPATVGSVRFNLDTGAINRIENLKPYALLGDSGSTYIPWEAAPGSHTLAVTPYDASGGTGTAGTTAVVEFSVVDEAAAVTALPTTTRDLAEETGSSALTGAEAPPEAVAALVSYWPLDEGDGDVVTEVVTGTTGDLVGFEFDVRSGWLAGDDGAGAALLFDGVDDQVWLGQPLTWPEQGTILLWLRPAEDGQSSAFFAVGDSSGSGGLQLGVDRVWLRCEALTTAGEESFLFEEAALAIGSWNLVAVVYDRAGVCGYIDGVFAGRQQWRGELRLADDLLGLLGGSAGGQFAGALDEVQVFDGALTGEQITGLYDGTLTVIPF